MHRADEAKTRSTGTDSVSGSTAKGDGVDAEERRNAIIYIEERPGGKGALRVFRIWGFTET